MADRNIPTFRAAIEERVWSNAYVRHLSGGATEAWTLANKDLEGWRDEAQRRALDGARIESEEGPAHV